MTGPQGQGAVIEQLCAAAKVSRASYYRGWGEREMALEEMALRDAIHEVCLEPDHRFYGYRRVTAVLGRRGWFVNAKRVRRLMGADNLLALRRKAYVPATTNSSHGLKVYPNLAGRMQPLAPNRLWVADITYIRLDRDFVYLAVVLDAFSRRVVGWALADHLGASLAIEALALALADRRPAFGALVHHSDRGVQYACADYARALEAVGAIPSMSRGGCPYDNAKAERFMRTLKAEEVDGAGYRDLEHARAEIGNFIEQVYNKRRLHSALDYLSPMEFENQSSWDAVRRPMTSTAANCT
ncbi:MAG: IS3 family transposase [Caulobacter sp.]|nr:IS3 family transposase [Caulobacter sp.]